MSGGFGFNQNFSHHDIGSGGVNSAFSEGWRPTELPRCRLWLRGDAGIILNGSNVSQWTDQTVFGNHFTQSTALNQPLYVSSNINSHPGLRFNGTTHNMVGPNLPSLFGQTTYGYWFSVIRFITLTLGTTFRVYQNDGILSDTSACSGLAVGKGIGISAYNYRNGTYVSSSYMPVSTGSTYVVGWDHQNTQMNCWLSSAKSTVGGTGPTTGYIGGMQLGSCQSMRYMHADVCEIVAGSIGISEPDRGRLFEYFAAKYNITL